MKAEDYIFTHIRINEMWENTIFQPSDFIDIDYIGESDEGHIFQCTQENGVKRILKAVKIRTEIVTTYK